MMVRTCRTITYYWALWRNEELEVALSKTKQYESRFTEGEYIDLKNTCNVFLSNGLKEYLANSTENFCKTDLRKWFDRAFNHCEEEIHYFITDIKRRSEAS
ncbi:hypothetical protein [Enterococcus wangshanyuanii]|uniref:Uncharacterized protein n=1 Tax=Enterococcus wangshanyuanii TaxID=2005703 RepID=A0ABQ1PD46_9ENTE|nr:hypothetical protein [Enterococcus wangshanyuanii]MTD40287.1 hypothetical protein [Erwinia sp. CPCC 100877]GGC94913.1 hypothetical protein GCM10011573_25700 [Enterococcus wangshanyuanii]